MTEPVRVTVTAGYILHRDGRPWYRLRRPWPWHPCTWATYADLDYGNRQIQRCACGGWRQHYLGWDDWSHWHDRNTRLFGRAHNITVH